MRTERRHATRRVAATCATACAALPAACNGTTSYLDATGTTGRQVATLGWWLTGVSCAVVLFVCLAILGGMARHRGEHNEPDREAGGARHTRDERGNGDGNGNGNGPLAEGAAARRRGVQHGLRWLYVGTAATVVVLLLTFAGTMVALDASSRAPREPALSMEVIGHQWWWEVRYHQVGRPDLTFFTANEVHLPVGQPVRVQLRSADVIHSFWLPQITGKMDLVPGQLNETWVEAGRAGSSRGMCGEYCGLQHAVMALAVTAESPADFARWMQARRTPAPPPATAETRIGQSTFVRSCGACHTVDGTSALGRVGPDLSHLASRPTIGAGALANTPANLAHWIVDAPAIKEGARMPAIPLDSTSLRAVVAYLETLR